MDATCHSLIEEENVFVNDKNLKNINYTNNNLISQDHSNINIVSIVLHPINTSFGILKWTTKQIDKNIIHPLASHLSESIFNPNILSINLWKKVKNMTPQRARDLTRLISTSISNSFNIFQGTEGKILRKINNDVQTSALFAISSDKGRETIQNGFISMVKIAEAINTSETQEATKQIVSTMHSFFELMSSPKGKQLIDDTANLFNQLCKITASPETTIFLTELAANICYALEVEEKRHKMKTSQDAYFNKKKDNGNIYMKQESVHNQKDNVNNKEINTMMDNDNRMKNSKSPLVYNGTYLTQLESDILRKLGLNQTILNEHEKKMFPKESFSIINTNNKNMKDIFISNDVFQENMINSFSNKEINSSNIILPKWNVNITRELIKNRYEDIKNKKIKNIKENDNKQINASTTLYDKATNYRIKQNEINEKKINNETFPDTKKKISKHFINYLDYAILKGCAIFILITFILIILIIILYLRSFGFF